MNENVIVKFDAKPIKMVYEKNGFRMYGCNSDSLTVHKNSYGNIMIKGDIPELSEKITYHIEAEELYDSKYGYSYKVIKIQNDLPKTEEEIFIFLQEILTHDQAMVLWKHYPNIIDLVKSGKYKTEVDVSKLKGIGDYTLNLIADKIKQNYVYMDLISYFKGAFSFATIKKLYEKYTSIEKIKEILRNDPYKFLTNIDRIGFKKADEMILRMEKEGIFQTDGSFKCSKQRCMGYITYTLKQNEVEGNTKMSLISLQKMCRADVSECIKHFVECVKSEVFLYDIDDQSICLKNTHRIEEYIAERLVCANVTPIIYDIPIVQQDNDIQLTDEQMQGINNFMKYNVSIIDGPGGSGKTASTQAIVNSLNQAKKSFILLAPTGRAAKVLSEYTHYSAFTIHRGLGYSPMEGWVKNQENPLSQDVVIVDEFSMVDIWLFKHLLDAIDFTTTKLLIIGDSAQLNSVQAGNCLHDMLDSHLIPETTLTKIFRYSEGGLMMVATDTRNCKPFLKDVHNKVTIFGTNQDYTFIQTSKDKVVYDTVKVYQNVLEQGYKSEDILVLTAYNKGEYGTIVLNKLLQKIANLENMKGDNYKGYYLNDLVLQTVNNYKSSLYDMDKDMVIGNNHLVCNGEIGRVVRVLYNGVVVKFDDHYVLLGSADIKTVQLGYAISVHKSQGGSAKVVILSTPDAHQYMLNSNLLYVGLTRMKEKCYHIGNAETINRIVKKKENLQRMTNLRGLLEAKGNKL